MPWSTVFECFVCVCMCMCVCVCVVRMCVCMYACMHVSKNTHTENTIFGKKKAQHEYV